MEEVQPTSETETDGISKDNLLTGIFVAPGATLRYILRNCPEKYMTILLILGGIESAVARASMKHLGDTSSTALVLSIAIVGGSLFGWISYYIYAWLMKVMGEWIDGKARTLHFRIVLVWSLIPAITSFLLLIIPELIIFGDDLFKSEPENDSALNSMLSTVFSFIKLATGIWTVVILVKGISIIQGFSIWKSILNMILPVVVFVLPILVVLFLIGRLN